MKLYFQFSWNKLEVSEKLSLNIGENPLIKIDTPPNYIGDIEYSVTPWINPISKYRFTNAKEANADKKTRKDTVSDNISRIFGAKKRVKLMVCRNQYSPKIF